MPQACFSDSSLITTRVPCVHPLIRNAMHTSYRAREARVVIDFGSDGPVGVEECCPSIALVTLHRACREKRFSSMLEAMVRLRAPGRYETRAAPIALWRSAVSIGKERYADAKSLTFQTRFEPHLATASSGNTRDNR